MFLSSPADSARLGRPWSNRDGEPGSERETDGGGDDSSGDELYVFISTSRLQTSMWESCKAPSKKGQSWAETETVTVGGLAVPN